MKVDRRRGPRPAVGVTVPENVAPVIAELFVEINRQRISTNDLEAVSGVGRRVVERWRHTHNPRLDNLIAVGSALGLELVWQRRAG